MVQQIISSAMMLLGSVGIFLFVIKMQNNKLQELDRTKLDKERFETHLKSFDELKDNVREVRDDMAGIRLSINTNNELLIRVDERLKNKES